MKFNSWWRSMLVELNIRWVKLKNFLFKYKKKNEIDADVKWSFSHSIKYFTSLSIVCSFYVSFWFRFLCFFFLLFWSHINFPWNAYKRIKPMDIGICTSQNRMFWIIYLLTELRQISKLARWLIQSKAIDF